METKLVRIGDEYAVVLDDQLIELLKITAETRMEITVQGDTIVATPVREQRQADDQQPLSE